MFAVQLRVLSNKWVSLDHAIALEHAPRAKSRAVVFKFYYCFSYFGVMERLICWLNPHSNVAHLLRSSTSRNYQYLMRYVLTVWLCPDFFIYLHLRFRYRMNYSQCVKNFTQRNCWLGKHTRGAWWLTRRRIVSPNETSTVFSMASVLPSSEKTSVGNI